MSVRAAAVLLGIVLACLVGSSAASYTDPSLLDVPWGKYSFIRQGWRGYLETVPAARYRDGLGIVWGESPPGRSADEVARELSWAGFRRVRLEIPWGAVTWDETGLDAETRLRAEEILRALKAHHLRPLVLLNANHLKPCPTQWRDFKVLQPAGAGDRALVVSGDLGSLPALGVATIMSLADSVQAGPLITEVGAVAAQGRGDAHLLRLSKPLPRAVAEREALRVAILRYPPLFPVGTPQFEATAAGWLHYVSLVASMVENVYGSDEYDMEIWNELTFGSAYLDVENYGEAPQAAADPLRPGGSAWELARRTVKLLKSGHPGTQVLWGFSNTTFFHTPIAELPPAIDGQSYHPYGTGRRCFADLSRARPDLLLDGFVPSGCAVQPEGYALAWQQTESLLRFIAPAARLARPQGTTRFAHVITEHGFLPAELGITDRRAIWFAKQGFVLRASLAWLNKGLDALYIYDLYSPQESGFGVLGRDGAVTPALEALHRLTAELEGPERVRSPRQLTLEIARQGRATGILPGDPDGRHLPDEQAVALLPFQVDDGRFVIAAYVMTQDFPRLHPRQTYRVTIGGIHGWRAIVRYYSPATDSVWPARIVARTSGSVTLRLSLVETPNLVEIFDAPGARRQGAG